jgi:membrane-associated PAP2 superfamily phosphatase
MKRFGYARDPLCLAACACYVGNRWLVPFALKGLFLQGYFADCLLIPAALPLLLWLQRRTGLRRDDRPPKWNEIFLHLAVWSVAAEIIAPHLFSRATGDPWDVAAYAGGALLSGVLWQLS